MIRNTSMHRRSLLTLLWLFSDALVFIGSYALAYFVKVGWILSSDLPLEIYLEATLLTAAIWIIVMITMRNYGLSRVQMSARNCAYIAYACLIGMAGFALAFYFLKQSLFSRMLLLLAGVFSTLSVFLWHIIFDRFQRIILRISPPTYPILIIGTNREAERLIETLERKQSPFTPVAILDGRGSSKPDIAGVPVIGKLDKLEKVLKEKRITHVVQCDQLEHSLNLVSICRTLGITYMLLPFVLGVIEDHVPMEALEGRQVVSVPHGESRLKWFFR